LCGHIFFSVYYFNPLILSPPNPLPFLLRRGRKGYHGNPPGRDLEQSTVFVVNTIEKWFRIITEGRRRGFEAIPNVLFLLPIFDSLRRAIDIDWFRNVGNISQRHMGIGCQMFAFVRIALG
jgi:hypothetical protein